MYPPVTFSNNSVSAPLFRHSGAMRTPRLFDGVGRLGDSPGVRGSVSTVFAGTMRQPTTGKRCFPFRLTCVRVARGQLRRDDSLDRSTGRDLMPTPDTKPRGLTSIQVCPVGRFNLSRETVACTDLGRTSNLDTRWACARRRSRGRRYLRSRYTFRLSCVLFGSTMLRHALRSFTHRRGSGVFAP